MAMKGTMRRMDELRIGSRRDDCLSGFVTSPDVLRTAGSRDYRVDGQFVFSLGSDRDCALSLSQVHSKG